MENVSPCDLENAEGPAQQGVLQGQNAHVRELPWLDQRRDLRRAHHQPEIGVGVALVGDDLDGLLKHQRSGG